MVIPYPGLDGRALRGAADGLFGGRPYVVNVLDPMSRMMNALGRSTKCWETL